jgi:hypothetical protein
MFRFINQSLSLPASYSRRRSSKCGAHYQNEPAISIQGASPAHRPVVLPHLDLSAGQREPPDPKTRTAIDRMKTAGTQKSSNETHVLDENVED